MLGFPKIFLALLFLLGSFTACVRSPEAIVDAEPSPENIGYSEIIGYSTESWFMRYEAALLAMQDKNWILAQDLLDSAFSEIIHSAPESVQAIDTLQWRTQRSLLIIERLEEVFPKLSELGQAELGYDYDFDEPIETLSQTEIQEIKSYLDTLDLSRFSIPIELNERVMAQIHYLSKSVPKFTESSLSRKTLYQDMILKTLAEKGMPEDLIYLPLVESGFKVRAYSSAKASGLWQFIPETGRRYGLAVDYWVDMRRNPPMATDAGLRYLSDLYKEFGDWHLAMAAYNCGEGRVRRLIREHNTRNFWELPLPKETMVYVPRILAAMIIGHHPEHYGFNPEKLSLPSYDTVSVQHCLPLDNIAKSLNVTLDTIHFLNPELTRWCTPPNLKEYTIRVPEGYREEFLAAYEKMDKTSFARFHRHKILKGESLGNIARKYGVSISAIQSANNMKNARIRAGNYLVVPLPQNAAEYKPQSEVKKSNSQVAKAKTEPINRQGDDVIYTVKSGDNLSDISRRYGVGIEEIQAWNDLKGTALKVDQKLKIRVHRGEIKKEEPAVSVFYGKTQPYMVKPGDSFYSIAIKYGISTDQLKELNQAKTSRLVSGHFIQVPDNQDEVNSEPVALSFNGLASYQVKSGDNLYDISRKLGVSINDLMKWNGLNQNSKLSVGQSLVLSQTSVAKKESSEKKKYYSVQSGDTLWNLSRRFGISVEDLRKWNDLKSDNLRVGDKLLLMP
jgi:membrane-bound lytic murein transglycosylase D